MINSSHQDSETLLPWKFYAVTFLEVGIAFTLATFLTMMYMTHLDGGTFTIICAVLMGLLYIFVLVFCVVRMMKRLSIAALMLMIPIAPLAVLLLVVSLLPIVQKLQ